jgi:hypothetical protein
VRSLRISYRNLFLVSIHEKETEMGRKKRHKLVSAFVLGLLAISLAIYEFRGELMMPSVTPSITRRELLIRRMMALPNDISVAIDRLQMLSPSISSLPGKAPHEPPGTMELAPTVQSAAPPIQPVSPALQSPAPSITSRNSALHPMFQLLQYHLLHPTLLFPHLLQSLPLHW